MKKSTVYETITFFVNVSIVLIRKLFMMVFAKPTLRALRYIKRTILQQNFV